MNARAWISRRRFVALTVRGVGLIGLAGVVGCETKGDDQAGDSLAERFRAHFDYLKIDEEGLMRFLADYQEAYGPLVDASGKPRDKLPFIRFLESSDFFMNGMDENQPVRYLALYDPYLNPCFRPFPTD